MEGFLTPARKRRAAIVGAAVLLYTLVGFFVVPPVARNQIEKMCREKLDREATVERVTFNPFTLVAGLEGFDMKDRDGAPLARLARLRVNLEASSLFRWAWTFREVSLGEPEVVLRLMPDGNPSVADWFAPPPTPEPVPDESDGLPRLLIEHFALAGGKIDFIDESRSPAFSESLAPLELELEHLTNLPEHDGKHSISLGIGQDSLVRWSGEQSMRPFELRGRFEVSNIVLPRLWEFAAHQHDLELYGGHADLDWSYDVRKQADAIHVVVDEATLHVRDVALRARGGDDDWLAIPAIAVVGIRAAWPEATLEVASVRVTDPALVAWMEREGSLNWMLATAPPASPEPTANAGTESGTRWTASIDAIEISGGQASFEDRRSDPPTAFEVAELTARCERVTSDLASAIGFEASMRIDESGRVEVSGDVTPEPLTGKIELRVADLAVVPFGAYLTALPGAEIRDGRAGVAGTVDLAADSTFSFAGEASLDGLAIAGAGSERLVAWKQAKAKAIRASNKPLGLHIGALAVDGAYAQIAIDENGVVNLSALSAPDSRPESPPASPTAAGENAEAGGSLRIDTIELSQSTIDFKDESLILPFATEIREAAATIRDLSTTGAAAARLDFEGRVGATGLATASGTLRVSDPFASTAIDVVFREVPMTDLTPYVAEFAGYSVASGALDLDIHYRIEKRRLVGDHKVVATDLTLGPKVEGAEGPGLPVRLAIALLKDKQGRIDLVVPVEGDVDAPEFDYGFIVKQAIKKILLNVVQAPFRAIGRMMGRDEEEDLDLVGFMSGQVDLPEPERESLTALAGELSRRSEIAIAIGGRYDPVADDEALRRVRLEQRIDAARDGVAPLEAIIERVYAERLTAEKLEAQRLAFPEPAAFYDALRAELLEAESVLESEVIALGRARADAIAAVLTAGGLEPARVSIEDPAPVKRKKQGSDLIPSELLLSAGD